MINWNVFGKGFENTKWLLITPWSSVYYLKTDAIAACYQRIEKIRSVKRRLKINLRKGIKYEKIVYNKTGLQSCPTRFEVRRRIMALRMFESETDA